MFIPINLQEVQESKPVSAGMYDLIITAVEETRTKEKGKPQLRVTIVVDGHDSAPHVTHFVGLPAEGDEPQAANFKALLLKRFLTLFDIPYGAQGFNVEEFIGTNARAELSLSEPDDNGNVYNRLVLPRLRGESDVGRSQGRTAPSPPKR